MQGAEVRVAEKPEELAVKAVMTFPHSEGGGMTFETYFGQDSTLKAINDLCDKLWGAAKRQKLWSELERERQFVYNDGAEIDRMTHSLQMMDLLTAEKAAAWEGSGRRGEFKLPEAEHNARKGIVANLDMLKQRRQQHIDKVDELRKELGLPEE